MDGLTVILAAAGQGTRLGLGKNKAFVCLQGVPLVVHNLKQINQVEAVQRVVVVVGASELAEAAAVLSLYQAEYFPRLTYELVAGGRERQDSVANALKALGSSGGYIAVHDGARPFATPDLFARVLAAAQTHGAAIAAVAVKDTIKVVNEACTVVATPLRSTLRAVQTPQIFKADVLYRAYALLAAKQQTVTDDAAAVEQLGIKIKVVEGSYTNNKITTPEDLVWAREFLKSKGVPPMTGVAFPFHVGSGFDVHQFAKERKLILCGVEIPYALGLAGHSDADVALHALMDALLGAVGMGDIGKLFPDTEEVYKDADSSKLLEQVLERLVAAGWQVGNVDITIIAQKPKIAAYREQMQQRLMKVLALPLDAVNVKATTTEKLGFTGRGEGIAAQAAVTVFKAIQS
ncbi:MAG: 2-C-methyl-D-erythritol 4-phosphate cytidylyltransferase [Acidaminococcaceae bacterium]